jgi:hypothetical protein
VHKPAQLRFEAFGGPRDPLGVLDSAVSPRRQVQYLRCYLHDLGAATIVIEPNYFDRDYLSEFVAFYSTSSAGYPNICQRLHFFSSEVTRAGFTKALGGDEEQRRSLEASYLGHVILRPIPGAPLGRTVLRTYPDDEGIAAGTPRIMGPARSYEAHVAGLTLRVFGLAWQQQDSAVGSCATVALWSMLHSSAFDDHHAIPSTAEITSSAHGAVPMGTRVFPADGGLRLDQMLEVIKSHGLAPVVITGDNDDNTFTPRRFNTLVASFVRSGYPVLVHGELDASDPADRSLHAACIVGFRSPATPKVKDGTSVLADENIAWVYLHDDNLGPNARFRVSREHDIITLIPEAPPPRFGAWPTANPTTTYHPITPTEIVVAVHQELRTDPLRLQSAAVENAAWLPSAMAHEYAVQQIKGKTGMTVGSRFIRLRDYVDRELGSALRNRTPAVRSRARLALWEKVAPMSLHIGLVRVAFELEPMMDILFDTSDSDRHLRPSAYVAYHPQVPWLLDRYRELIDEDLELGTLVRAW